jgi:hypothetical protein
MIYTEKDRRLATIEEMKFQLTVMKHYLVEDTKHLYVKVLNEYIGPKECVEFCENNNVW